MAKDKAKARSKPELDVDWGEIRHEYETTTITMNELASRIGCAPSTVRNRKRLEKWSDERKSAVASDRVKEETVKISQDRARDKPKPKTKPKERAYCGAKAKGTGQPCRRPAGWGTSHPGTGRCKLHGGKSTGPKDRTRMLGNQNGRKHGIYQTIIANKLEGHEKVVFEALPDDVSMVQELRILRFKLLRLLDPVEKEMFSPGVDGAEKVKLEVDEVTKAYAIEKLVDGIRKLVKDTKDDITPESLVRIIDDISENDINLRKKDE